MGSEPNTFIASTKCHFCERCDGYGCIGELPGMGGVFENENFITNCASWQRYYDESVSLPKIRLAPITGAVENIGWHDEKSFYLPFLKACKDAGVLLSIGDGIPDEKLLTGIEALKTLNTQAAVFIKPYPDTQILERIQWANDVAAIIGIDIDSYNIVTMRKLVHLEKKTDTQLITIKRKTHLPFALKGIFTVDDIALLQKVKPDIAVISNHGGRVETAHGSTADFLNAHGKTILTYVGELWVDGGLRTRADLQAASRLGASTVMLARPFITSWLRSGDIGPKTLVKNLTYPSA